MKLSLSLNPVLVKEMRGRMRGPRAYLLLTAALAILGVVTYGLYRLVRFSVAVSGGLPSGAVIGQSLFTGLVLLATLVICAIAPSLTAAAISGEHERKTYDLLLATPLSPSSILLGKLLSAWSYVALVLMAMVPMVSLAFLFGGVAWVDLIRALLLLLGFAVAYSVLGLFFSALFRRTALAVGASYLVLVLFTLGTFFAYAVAGVIRQDLPPNWILSLNPFSAAASALGNASMPGAVSFGRVVSIAAGFLGGMGMDPNAPAATPLWHLSLGVYAWLTVALYLATTQLIKPVRRFEPRRRTLAVAAVWLAVGLAAPPVVYGPLTPARVAAWLQWLQSSPRNLIANGEFASPLESKWQTGSFVDRGDEAAGTVALATEGDRPVVRFQRAGRGQSTTSLTQTLNQRIAVEGWLQLRAVVRVQSATPGNCGAPFDACPLTIKLEYDTLDGGRREWTQGFALADGAPVSCVRCGDSLVQMKPGEWRTYESPNLLSAAPLLKISAVRAITLAAAGQSYQVQVAEVALLAREGRPLDWSGRDNSPTPTPVIIRAPMVPSGIIVPAMPVVVPPPPPTEPAPAPTPSSRPSPTR